MIWRWTVFTQEKNGCQNSSNVHDDIEEGTLVFNVHIGLHIVRI